MAFKFFDGGPSRVPYRQVIINPVNDQVVIDGPIYNVISEANNLSNSDVGGHLPDNADATQSSVFLLDTFGFTVIEGLNSDITLASGAGLSASQLESLTSTSDTNPNRDETTKFDSLKTGKISVAKVFDQKTNNSINELDQNIAIVDKIKPKAPQQVIAIASDFLDYSPKQVVARVKK